MAKRIDDANGRASEELSEVLEAVVADGSEEPVTLGMARDKLKQALAEQGREASRRIGSEQLLYAHLESLVEEYGEDAPAMEELLDLTKGEHGVTIGQVREAVRQVLMADLEGEGRFAPGVEQPLLAELDTLIERYGADAPAEDLLRFD